MNEIPILDNDSWDKKISTKRCELYSMFSSTTSSITKDMSRMVVPIDDHLVHRGDGVFESFKCVEGSIYNLDAHLDRFRFSSEKIGLKIPYSKEHLKEIIIQTTRASEYPNSSIRVLLSRGTGTMGIDPFECTGEVLYVIVYSINKIIRMDSNLETASLATSLIPVKAGYLAKVKSCNYLTNVLMKIEEQNFNVDYVVSIDEDGNIGEGATENIGIVTNDDRLITPLPERVLPGTTAKRIIELGKNLVEKGDIKYSGYENFSQNQMIKAKEIHIYGTTQGVVSVTKYDDCLINHGKPGKIAQKLFQLLKEDKVPENTILTKVF
tara:strand:- start:2112 stop:3080 length:969 start_codon:yes stop_codon:yes gene_type:complete